MSEPPTTRPRGDSRWWFRPPRRHGEVLAHRTVSYLELFYDLVFLVLIAQISRTLAGDVTWAGIRDVLIVFALIWIAWVNGTLYHDLHGREDGRSRTYIFAQVSLLVLLSVFTVQAAEDPSDGRGFALSLLRGRRVVSALRLGCRSYQEYVTYRCEFKAESLATCDQPKGCFDEIYESSDHRARWSPRSFVRRNHRQP